MIENDSPTVTAITARPISRRKLILWAGLAILALCAAVSFPFAWQRWVNWRYADDIYASKAKPASPSFRRLRQRRLSAMLLDRVDTGIDL